MSQRHMLFMLSGGAVGYFLGNKADASTPAKESFFQSKAFMYALIGLAAGWFAAKYV